MPALIDAILDTMIPADGEAGMPPASAAGFTGYADAAGIRELVDAYARLVAALAVERECKPFEELDEDRRMAIVNGSRTADIRLFSAFVTHVFRAYYTDRAVLECIGSGSVPPFPEGNAVPEDDWSMLTPVYERGPVYRPVEEK